MLPPLDPQREQDLYRSLEAEFLENTRQVKSGAKGGTRTHLGPTSDITDSAYSSSNSSSSSLNVGSKAGSLPDLKESRRTQRPLPVDDPLTLLTGQCSGASVMEQWAGRGLKRLPAISSSSLDRERSADTSSHLQSQVPLQVLCGTLNGAGGSAGASELNHQRHFPHEENGSADLQRPGDCPLPLTLPLSEEFPDSSSESSSMCFSLSESPPAGPHPSGLLNGGTESSSKDLHKHKLRTRVRPRTDPGLPTVPPESPPQSSTGPPVTPQSALDPPVTPRSASDPPVTPRSASDPPVTPRSALDPPVTLRSASGPPVTHPLYPRRTSLL
ncbi:hypothetical protein WMY93_004914 [Mugilogobius chulae]|uniref:Uncharacterized protein n=1 Tax=Mugilogobius chulae TaxID=88201 RepID=A0AAW0Q122_9GOBI